MPFGRREPIICIELDKEFRTKQDAADYLGIPVGSVFDSLRDGRSHRGYTFVYKSDRWSFVSSETVQPVDDWYDIPGYEGLYQITKNGVVWSCCRVVNRNSGRPNIIRGSILSPHMNPAGYLMVALTDTNHRTRKYLLHRLVAMTFIPNPENKPEVNHIDGDKLNCHIDNLEWVTIYENQYHAVVNGLTPAWSESHMQKMCDAAFEVCAKPVLCVTTGEIFRSKAEACRALNLGHSAVVTSIRENRPYRGYLFKELADV